MAESANLEFRMKILVTGGAGFIGSHIVEQLHGRAEVRVLDNLRSGHRRNLASLRCELMEGSVLDRPTVRRAMEGVDYVFHLAAMVSVPESMQKPMECAEANTVGTLVVLEEAARAGVKKLAFSSSAAVYGDNPTVPKIETMTPEPVSPYAMTKLDGEFYCAMFTHEKRLATVCLRYFNVFGPRQDSRSQYAAAVPAFIERALKNEPLVIYGDGDQTRDFVPVQTVAAANVFLTTRSEATGVFNVAGGSAVTINWLAKVIRELAGSRSEICHAAPRAGDVKHSCADISRLSATGFADTTDSSSALRSTVESFRPAAE
jgi:UDP-glucose 4-epimerase